MQTIFDYIQKNKWFFGVRAEESLFFYSAKYLKRQQEIKKYYSSNFVETLLFPLKNDYPVRLFNLGQAKIFHEESLAKAMARPEILVDFIYKDKMLWQEIEKLSLELHECVKETDYESGLKIFKGLLNYYGEYGALGFINFSLGKVMTEKQDQFKTDVSSILQQHNQWRNSVVFNEEKLGLAFYEFLKLLVTIKKIKVEPLLIMKYLTVNEVFEFLQAKLSNSELVGLIKTRQKNGYIFAYLRKAEFQGAIDDKKAVAQIKKHFTAILAAEKSGKFLKGMSTYIVKNKIKAQVVVIKDKNELAGNKIELANKILVAIQTTPHFIPYLKGVKGIITDEGGITCHAAIVSREMKIPCVVGTKNATEFLRTNDVVEIDTKNGRIVKVK